MANVPIALRFYRAPLDLRMFAYFVFTFICMYLFAIVLVSLSFGSICGSGICD